MRLNKYLALATGMSRRAADEAITEGKVTVNNALPSLGQQISDKDIVTFDGHIVTPHTKRSLILLHKPPGYVCSRNGQGSKTIYALLPRNFHHLKPVGRLDKDSSGLILLTNDGDLAHRLTHPRFHKSKVYEVELDKPLAPLHKQMISDHGLQLEDGVSKLQLDRLHAESDREWRITMSEGRNRQIRRTFAAVGYSVTKLHRTHFGTYKLDVIKPGAFQSITSDIRYDS